MALSKNTDTTTLSGMLEDNTELYLSKEKAKSMLEAAGVVVTEIYQEVTSFRRRYKIH